MLSYDKNSGKVRDSSDVDFVDKLFELKELKGKWDVLDFLVEYWTLTSPEDAKGFMITLDDLKETRKDRKHGKTEDKNMDRRLIMVMPLGLQNMIRRVYPVGELPFDKKFFLEFADRYRQFQVPEKL